MREAAGGICIIAAGVFLVLTSIMNSERFFGEKAVRRPLFIDKLGRNGSRMIYAALGVMSIFIGISMIILTSA